VSCCGERGLLSIAFHPDYAANGRFFVDYTNVDGDSVVSRFQAFPDGDTADAASEQILITIPQFAPNHNGGQLAFGRDRYLYVSLGDGGGGDDPEETGQDLTTLLGKILRLDVDVEAPPYHAAPPTNPFAGRTDARAEIWAFGLRNPWRMSFDRATGDLYIGDVGQSSWEEIDVQPAASRGGENYGWDVFEGAHCHEPTPPATECLPGPAGRLHHAGPRVQPRRGLLGDGRLRVPRLRDGRASSGRASTTSARSARTRRASCTSRTTTARSTRSCPRANRAGVSPYVDSPLTQS
jgi:glucose/arabinose dehydrogenase